MMRVYHLVTSAIVSWMSIIFGPAISRIWTLYNINVGSTLATYPFITQCLIILFVLLSVMMRIPRYILCPHNVLLDFL